ncbi:MAG TPA: hypothetical protein VFR94_06265 [Nitrososphaeraceae archaeon]|nr:hypothetical protein [Nitrososphaeraceae archaeon]
MLENPSIAEAFCPTNTQKQAQTNTVIVQQEKMDLVGFEPTTFAAAAAFLGCPF